MRRCQKKDKHPKKKKKKVQEEGRKEKWEMKWNKVRKSCLYISGEHKIILAYYSIVNTIK